MEIPQERVGRVANKDESDYFAIEKERSDLWIKQFPEAAVFADNLLNSVHLGTVKSIFSEYVRGAGGRTVDVNTIPRDRFLFSNSPKVDGGYHTLYNGITIGVSKGTTFNWIFEHRSELNANAEMRSETCIALIFFLKMLMHEQVHAHAYSEIQEKPETGFLGIRRRQDFHFLHGYDKTVRTYTLPFSEKNTPIEKGTLEFWNEGFTEWLAHSVTRRYLIQDPFEWNGLKITAREFDAHSPEVLEGSGYAAAVLMVGQVIDSISTVAGVPRETVERGIIRGALTESGRSDLIYAMSEIYSSEYVQEVMRMQPPTYDHEAGKMLAEQYVTDHPEIRGMYGKTTQ